VRGARKDGSFTSKETNAKIDQVRVMPHSQGLVHRVTSRNNGKIGHV
jgi:hypothetical protein